MPPNEMVLTPEEIERYGGFGDQPEFKLGFDDYNAGRRRDMGLGVEAQAYNRGAECAMRRKMAALREAARQTGGGK
jgi:hypothetical protein